MIKLKDLYEVSEWGLYTPNGVLMDAYFIKNNGNMLVEKIDIYSKVDIDNLHFHIIGLKVFLYDSIYEDTDSVVTP